MPRHMGGQSIVFSSEVSILSTSSIAGPKEGKGPIGFCFDEVMRDSLWDESSWEKAESKMVERGFRLAVEHAGLKIADIDYILAGDLLNQSAGSTFGIRSLGRPFLGLFGACSTFGEALSLGSVLIGGGFADNILAGASSHFCAAEKQFRFPLELGTQRPLTSSWTVTGDGAAVLSRNGSGPYITAVTTGKIIDLGVTDSSNMGAAMAPAAADTLMAHFNDTGRDIGYYDVIATGDLGHIGKNLAEQLLKKYGVTLENYTDCGIEIFDRETQDTHSGGSGCGCSAVTFCGYYFRLLKKKKINRMLLVPTGALMSPTSAQQGESIPGIAHAVAIEN